jgi:hypothetical protein
MLNSSCQCFLRAQAYEKLELEGKLAAGFAPNTCPHSNFTINEANYVNNQK